MELAKYEIGHFCTQYGLPSVKPSKRKHKHKGKESFEKPFRRKPTKYNRKQRYKTDDFYKKGKPKEPIPQASGKCYNCTQPLVQEASKPEVQQPKVDLNPIYNKALQPKKEVKTDDLQGETKETRNEIRTLKQHLQAFQKTQSLENTSCQSNEEGSSDNKVDQIVDLKTDHIQKPTKDLFLDAITRINFHKWHSKVRIVISKDFEFEVIALIDSGADLNCIQEGIIPSKYFKKSRERLTSASGGRMQIEFKLPKAHIYQDNMCFKTTFVLVKNLTDKVILGNPFLCSLYPFTVDSKGITTQPFGQTIKFRFISKPIPRNISTIQPDEVSETVNLISAKTAHLKYL